MTVAIFNTSGQAVKSTYMGEIGPLDVFTLPVGSYLEKVKIRGKFYSKLLLINHSKHQDALSVLLIREVTFLLCK